MHGSMGKKGGITGRRLLLAGIVLAVALAVSAPAGATFPGTNGRIAFSTDFSNPSQVFTMRPDGSGLRQLTHLSAGHSAVSPAWSPNGTRIAFTISKLDPSNSENTLTTPTWAMNADGRGRTKWTHEDGSQDATPSWPPAGPNPWFPRSQAEA